MMYFHVYMLSLLVLASSTAFATIVEMQETPLALPVASQTTPTTSLQGEIWEEDDHEILIRNERGTKTDGTFIYNSKLTSIKLT